MSNSTTFDDDGFTSNNIGLTGTAGSRDQFNYGVNVSHQRQDSETTAGTNLTSNTPVATLNGSYSQSSNYTQTGGSISGGVVAPEWRVEFIQPAFRYLCDYAGSGT